MVIHDLDDLWYFHGLRNLGMAGLCTCLPREASFKGLPSTRCSLAGFFPRQGPGASHDVFSWIGRIWSFIDYIHI